MPAIQFKSVSYNADGTKTSIPVVSWIPPKYRVQIEWVRHSRFACIGYLLYGAVSTAYYVSAFITQYGVFPWLHDPRFEPMECLNEPTLTRVIMIQWLILAAVLIMGLAGFRRIFMPLYIFLAVMASNGTLALFVIKLKQLHDGKIGADDISLNLVGVLLFTATAHNLIYLYAINLYVNSIDYSHLHQEPLEKEKKDTDYYV